MLGAALLEQAEHAGAMVTRTPSRAARVIVSYTL
jgi:hypothetical protein